MSLGGWWRLWLVGTVVVLAYNLNEALAYRDLSDHLTRPSFCVPFTTVEGKIRHIVGYSPPIQQKELQSPPDNPDGLNKLRQMVDKSLRKQNPYDEYFAEKLTEPQPIIKEKNVYSCVSLYRLIECLIWTLMVSVGVIAIGYLMRWVVHGFKEKQK